MAGVEMLRYQQSRTSDAHLIRRKTSPFVATLLSLFVPGLGAAYNGQTSKAIVHFAIFASLKNTLRRYFSAKEATVRVSIDFTNHGG